MDTALWPQANLDTRHLLNEMGMGMVNPPMERMTSSTRPQLAERRPRPHKEQPLSCPRCQSSNTKFCYYNNYSLSQPRYFCKTCRRYWTEGGSLRNVPVGGGSRKNKRHSATATNSSSSRRSSDILPPPPTSSSLRNPKFPEDKHLHFAFNPAEVSPFMPAAGADFTAAAFGLQDVRSTVEVNYHPLEAITGDRAYGGFQGEAAQENALKRGFFPFEDLRLVSSTATSFEQGRSQEGEASALWNGLMGGGNGSW